MQGEKVFNLLFYNYLLWHGSMTEYYALEARLRLPNISSEVKDSVKKKLLEIKEAYGGSIEFVTTCYESDN